MEKRLLLCLAIDVMLWSSAAAGGHMRLVGLNFCAGRVEIFHNDSWGTVCDDNWGLNEAEVVCRQVNCGSPLNATRSSHFGPGTGQIWLDSVHCAGNENSLSECKHAGFGEHDCDHNEDAGVTCRGGHIRLVGLNSCAGRVEIFHNDSWGTVCDDNWGLKEAEVVCRQVNCGSALNATSSAPFGPGSGQIWLDEVACTGNESFLSECQHAGFGEHDCKHSQDAEVTCTGGHMRLVGLTSCSGRVEIFHNDSWGTVCDDNWGLKEAEVVCRQVNCGSALNATSSAPFGPGTGRIWFDEVHCAGNESFLSECQHAGFGRHNCNHNEDAGVMCREPPWTVIYSVSAGVSGLLLLVLLVVICLVCRRRRAKRSEALSPTQMSVTHSFDAGQENHDDDDASYENVELMDAQMKRAEENDDQNEKVYVEAMDLGDDSAHNQEGSDDENDYENVSLPLEQQTNWTQQDIYDNI